MKESYKMQQNIPYNHDNDINIDNGNLSEQHINKQKYIEITRNDLPLRCPMPDMLSWNAHPRVFLEIEKEPNGTIICPYCSTKYKLLNL
jgi:uncharacterized Zn-finger protein